MTLEAFKARKPVRFFTRHRCSFLQIDPYGHLNTTFYLAYFLEHRFTGMREVIRLDLATLAKLPFGVYTTRAEVDFVRPLVADEEFEIESYASEFTETEATVLGEARKLNGKVAAAYKVVFACVDRQSGKPCPWPPDIIARFFLEE